MRLSEVLQDILRVEGQSCRGLVQLVAGDFMVEYITDRTELREAVRLSAMFEYEQSCRRPRNAVRLGEYDRTIDEDLTTPECRAWTIWEGDEESGEAFAELVVWVEQCEPMRYERHIEKYPPAKVPWWKWVER